MGKKTKILIVILTIFLVVFLVVSLAVVLFGKKIIESQFRQYFKTKVYIEDIRLGLPFTIYIKKLGIGDLLAVEQISFSPSILGLFAGKIILGDLTIVGPLINLEQSDDGRLNLPQIESKGRQPPVFLTSLRIKNGKFIFTDKKIDPRGYKIIADNIEVYFAKVMLPLTSLNTKFNFSFILKDLQDKPLGDIAGSGWIDFKDKDMDANIRFKNIEAVYFAPYYGDFLSKRRLLSAKLNFDADLKARYNDLKAFCHLELHNLIYAQPEVAEEKEEVDISSMDIFKNALDFFVDKEGKIKLDFKINTKLDKPQITSGQLQKIILEAAARNIIRHSPQEIIEKVNYTIEQFKAIGDQLKGIFKKGE